MMISKPVVDTLDATEFDWTQMIFAPSSDEGGVVPGIDIAAILHDAATEFVTGLFGATTLTSLSRLAVRPVLRAISATFERPLTPGTQVVVGVTLGSLSERSFVLTTAVWGGEQGQLVAHGIADFVVVDVASKRTVAVPGDVVDGLKRRRRPPTLPESS